MRLLLLFSHVQLFATPWTGACQAPLSSTVTNSLLKFMSIESVMLSNHLIFCRCLLFLSSIFPSIRIFSSESELHLRLLFSCSVLSNSLQPHGLQHARLPCPLLYPGVCSNSGPLSQWCYPTISSSVIPFSCFQCFPAWGSFLMSWPFTSGGQSIGAPASTSLPSNEYSGLISFRMDWFDLLAVKGTLKGLLQHHSLKTSILWHSAFFTVQLSHPYTTEKP